MTAAPPRRLSLGQRLAFGAGDVGINLYWNAANLFLLFFYTEAMGLSPRAAGAIMLAALIWDAVTDPGVGLLAERVRTPIGRYRPFLLLAPVPLVLALVAMFTVPGWEGGLWAYALGTQVAFRTLHTLVTVPYNALPTRLTQDSGERATLTGFRMVGAMIGAFVAATAFLPLTGAVSAPWGFTLAAAVIGGLGGAAVLVTGAALREPAEVVTAQAARPSPRAVLSMIAVNQPFWVVLGGFVSVTLSNAVFQAVIVFYFARVVGQEALVPVALAATLLGAVIGAGVWAALIPRLGRRRAWTIGLLLSAAALASVWVSVDAVAPILAALVVVGFGASVGGVVIWSAVPDTAEYGEWRTGTRSESLLVGLLIFSQKVATGLGAFVVALGLDLTGYAPGTSSDEGAILGLRLLLVAVPIGFSLIGVLIFSRYRLEAGDHAEILREIGARRAEAAI